MRAQTAACRRWPKMPAQPDLSSLAPAQRARIAEFNARPMRRADDIRICGWAIVESQS